MEHYLNLLILLSNKADLETVVPRLLPKELTYVYVHLSSMSVMNNLEINEIKKGLIDLAGFQVSRTMIFTETHQELQQKLIAKFIRSRNNILNWEVLTVLIKYYQIIEFNYRIILTTCFLCLTTFLSLNVFIGLSAYFILVYMVVVNLLWRYTNAFEINKIAELEEIICESNIGYIVLTVIFFPFKIIFNLLILLAHFIYGLIRIIGNRN